MIEFLREIELEDFSGYFPAFDLHEDELVQLGLSSCYVSIFDRWLSEQEAADSPLMSYSIALDAGCLEEYMRGERKFLRFYSSLSGDGVICNRPGPLRRLEANSGLLEDVLVNSLREIRLMDVYFIGAGLRVLGGYDRTDLVIAECREKLVSFQRRANEFGLFHLS